MGFCTDEEYEEFFRSVPEFERMLVRSGIILIKYWFSITDDEQHLRFQMRIHDPLKQWKLSPMDLESRAPLGGLHQGQGNDAGAHAYSRGALVDRGGQQEAGAAELHRPSAGADPLRADCARQPDAAARASTGRTIRARRCRRASTCRMSMRGCSTSALPRHGSPMLRKSSENRARDEGPTSKRATRQRRAEARARARRSRLVTSHCSMRTRGPCKGRLRPILRSLVEPITAWRRCE